MTDIPDIPTVARLLVALLKLLVFGIVLSLITFILILPFFISSGKDFESIDHVVSVYTQLVAAFITIFLFFRIIDKKKMSSLGLSVRGHVKEFLSGSGIAVLIMVVCFAILLLFKQIGFGVNPFDGRSFLWGFVLFVGVAVFEEVVFRGYILGYLMDATNKYVALILSSAIFSLLHIFNDHVSLIPMINLFLAGILLGSAYIYTRNLWFPIGMHLFWNFTQGSILGFNVSGTDGYSVIQLNYPENNLFNGGAFGLEGSFLISFFSVLSIFLVIRHYKALSKTESGFNFK